jgi:hypothetical protein
MTQRISTDHQAKKKAVSHMLMMENSATSTDGE